LLLDTHVLLWALADDPALTRGRREEIEDPANEVFVSAVSTWEIEIKRAAGTLEAPDDLLSAIAATGLSPLSVTLEHGVAAGGLPLHHRDPFDRLLIGQAQLEGMTLVTHDASLAAYPVAILPA
jgi:PIN domain nuclease of toxin-antitoxin system